MLTQIIAIFTALGSVGIGSWVSDWLKDRRARPRQQAQDESIVARTTVDLLQPTLDESQRRLDRIVYLKGIIREIDDYLDECRADAHSRGSTLPAMAAALRIAVDDVRE